MQRFSNFLFLGLDLLKTPFVHVHYQYNIRGEVEYTSVYQAREVMLQGPHSSCPTDMSERQLVVRALTGPAIQVVPLIS